ncbi:MAG: hypothetical protein ACKO90_41275, partial [Microcystis panniformis]
MLKTFEFLPTFSLLNKRWNFLIITAIILGAAVVLYLFNPATSKLFPPSPFHLLTGLYCPGCG